MPAVGMEKPSREAQEGPDENEIPFGYPTNVCDDVPSLKYLCCNCKNVLKRAQQTLCGHRYCLACLSWIVRNTKSPICQTCKEENPTAGNEGSLLTEEKAFSDAAINKEILELKVHCSTSGCNWTGIMRDYEEHQSLCECALISCHLGCGHVVIRKNLADHLEKECIHNMEACQKGKQKISRNQLQQQVCENSALKNPKAEPPKDKSRTAAVWKSKDCCRFSEIGCSFRGNKDKGKDHEKSSTVAHLALMLQFLKKMKTALFHKFECDPLNMISSPTSAKCPEGSALALHLQQALEVTGDLEVDCNYTGSSAEDELKLQRHTVNQKIAGLQDKVQVFENIVTVLNREIETSNIAIVSFQQEHGLNQNLIRNLEKKIADLQRSLALKDVVLSGLHMHYLASVEASYDGIFLWKIPEVSRKCQDAIIGRHISLCSPAFYTARYGYKACLRVYFNGDGVAKGTHVSLFFAIMKGEYDALLSWPFKHKVTFMLLDQNNREHVIDAFRPDLMSASFQRPEHDMNIASGCPMFLPLTKLQSPKHAYVKEDTLFIKCIIDTHS
ncbi:TNF receptor-associated factor 1 [Microcaecilia unicolor]|uniref:TNF receptor-associated factor n=1 Tax=Microcaecilia unicolor TaxID=1415580 RepID=A0A6P7YKC5_9AMPH|nr:TNF receptor-associated factor 1 [Microcaecilia unicolor]XP_030063439.1 TNF receptor-associated factor 1 [Microcaecilia unicolor]